MDIVSTLYLRELNISDDPKEIYDTDIYFSSKGHDVPGLYSILIALEFLPFDQLHMLRRLHGLPGHPDINTPFIPTNTGSLGMGISKAKGFARSKKILNKRGRIFVLLGDGELQEGQFWESLSGAVNHGLYNIIAICDHNKVQSDKMIQDVSPLGNLEEKIASFGWHVERIDGHSFEDIERCFKRINEVNYKPKFIIADTKKGSGITFMESFDGRDPQYYKYHSGAPSDTDYEMGIYELEKRILALTQQIGLNEFKPDTVTFSPAKVATPHIMKMVNRYSQIILQEAKKDKNLIALDADLVLDTGLIPLSESLPEQFVECGIAEMDMVSQAGALALSGLLPVCHSFACFLTPRANEQFFNNGTEKSKIIYSAFLSGLLPAGPGHSHQSIRDIGLLSSVPNLTIVAPANYSDLEQLFNFAVHKNTKATYIRIESFLCEAPEILFECKSQIDFGCGYTLVEGSDAILFGYGTVMLTQALNSAKILKEEFGIAVKVVNFPWLNKVNLPWLKTTVEGYRFILTIDNHAINGGMGEFLLSRVSELDFGNAKRAKMLGINGIPECGLPDEILEFHQLDPKSIAAQVYQFLRVPE
jgi:transketolase